MRRRSDVCESELDIVLRGARDSRRADCSTGLGVQGGLLARQKNGTRTKTVGKRRGTRIVLTLLITFLLVLGTVSWFEDSQANSPWTPTTSRFRAALVDELSIDSPNSSFISTTTNLLVKAGYTLDYYGPSQVTVELFRDLALKGYGLILLRSHTVELKVSRGEPDIGIITSEPYSSTGYLYEQLTDQNVAASLAPTPDLKYFAITPGFVRNQVQGRFPNSTVIMMGCWSIMRQGMAQAFLDKGASVYVGWTEQVTPEYTDAATLALLQSLVKGSTMGQAVSNAMNSAGSDPIYPAQLYFEHWTPANRQQAFFLPLSLNLLGALVAIVVLVPMAMFLGPKLFGELRKAKVISKPTVDRQ